MCVGGFSEAANEYESAAVKSVRPCVLPSLTWTDTNVVGRRREGLRPLISADACLLHGTGKGNSATGTFE